MSGDETSAGAPQAVEAVHDPPWRGIIALVLAVIWLGGLGSVLGAGLAWHWLHQGGRSPFEVRLLRVALGIGIVGLIVTAALGGLLMSSRST